MRSYGQVYNGIWVLLAIGICLESVRLGVWDSASGPVAGFIPFLAGVLIGFAGLFLFISSLLSGREGKNRRERFWPERAASVRIGLILAGLAAMAFLMPRLGFLITSILIMTFMLRILEPQKWIKVILISLGCCFLVYWLFSQVLQVNLPRGFLGI